MMASSRNHDGEPILTERPLKISDHRLIGALIYLAARYMHRETNELVENPDEPDLTKVRPMNDKKIAEVLGYDVTSRHSTREVGKLRDLRFKLPNGQEMFCLLKAEAGRGRGNVHYTINPELVYAGSKTNYTGIMMMHKWFVENKKENDE